MPFPSLCTRWAVFRVPLAPQFYDTLPSGLCPSFGGSESIYLAPAVLPRVRHIALPGPAGRKDHPLPLLVLADALFGKELVQLSRRYAEFVSDARALEPVPVLDKLLVEYDFGRDSLTTFRSSRISLVADSISCGMGQSIQGRPGAATLGRSRTIVFPRFTESLPIASPNHSAKDRSGAIHLANGMTSGDSNQVAPCPAPVW